MAMAGLATVDWSHFTIGDDDEEQLRKLNVEKYFTADELSRISEYELMRYRKLIQNHAAMHRFGLTLTKPWFVERYNKRLRKHQGTEPEEADIDYDAPHDADWTPQSERQQVESSQTPGSSTRPTTRKISRARRCVTKTQTENSTASNIILY